MPRPVPPTLLLKVPERKVNPFVLQSQQISKTDGHEENKQGRAMGRKRSGNLHFVAFLFARLYLYSLSNERGQ